MQYGLYAQLDFKLFVYVSGSGATEVVALRYKEAHPLAKRADADSGAIGPVIPVGIGPRFRWDLVQDSGGKWSSF